MVTGLLTGLAVRTAVALSFSAERQRSLAALSAAATMFSGDLTGPQVDPQSAARQLGAAAGGRLLWIGPAGHVRIDSAGPTGLVGRRPALPAGMEAVAAPRVALYATGRTWTAYAAMPLRAGTSPADGELLLVRDLTPLRAEQALLRTRLWLAGALLALLGMAAGLLMAGSVARPVESLTAATRRMQAGDLHQQVAVAGRGEVAALTAAFNDMAAQVATLDEQRRAFVADAAHELRTPLASLHALAEALLAGAGAPADALAGIARQTERMGRMVESLLTLARLDHPEVMLNRQTLQIGDLVREALWVVDPLARERNVRMNTDDLEVVPFVQGDPDWLHLALVNVLDNAVRHSPDGAEVRISSQAAGRGVRLAVEDAGPGVADELLSRLGTRFFRADPARGRSTGGAGLGLAIAARVVRQHAGRLTFDHAAAGGLRVIFDLPAASPEDGAS